MPTPKQETLLRDRIIKRLRQERPGFWVVIHGSAMQQRGLPDILGCYNGRYVGFEVKVPGEETSGLATAQRHTLEAITRAGGVAGVIASPEEALELLPA